MRSCFLSVFELAQFISIHLRLRQPFLNPDRFLFLLVILCSFTPASINLHTIVYLLLFHCRCGARQISENIKNSLHKDGVAINDSSGGINEKGMQSQQNNAIIISDTCSDRLAKLGGYLRVSVEGGGCSGFQYKFDVDDAIASDDIVFEKNGGKVIVDVTSLEYIKGCTIDFQTGLIRSAFRIVDNPQAQEGCSCGASFHIKT